jgi:hypothetical protein
MIMRRRFRSKVAGLLSRVSSLVRGGRRTVETLHDFVFIAFGLLVDAIVD